MLAQVKAQFLASTAAVAGGGPAVCTFEGHAEDVSNLGTYSFPTQPIGTPAGNRYVIVAVAMRSGAGNDSTISSATIAGQSCTVAAGFDNGGFRRVSFIATDAPVTSGTTATIEINITSGTALNCGISIYSVTGLGSTTPVDSDGTNTDNTGVTIDVTADGFVIGAAMHQASAGTYTWTNINGDHDTAIETSSAHHSSAHVAVVSTGTLTLTADQSASNAMCVGYVSFR